MTIATQRQMPLSGPVTVEEFDSFIDSQADLQNFELIDGVIVMMTNPTEPHEQIASNIGAPLKLAMDGRGCRTYIGGIRVQRSHEKGDTTKTKPDVIVRCGPPGLGNFIIDPLVVVEVLSPSTMDIDRGMKLDFYKTLQTLRHIVLVYQDQMRVEHYRRVEQGWDLSVLKGASDEIDLEAVDFRIDLKRVYFGLDIS